MSAEKYAESMILRDIERMRRSNLTDRDVVRKYREAHAKYVEHVMEGRGDATNGSAILAYYSTKKALAMLAHERGIALEEV